MFSLPHGASLIDFAYAIHTDLGNRMQAALVNGRRCPIDYQIQKGDRIQILKAPRSQVKKQWLQWTSLPSTRRKINAQL